MFDNIGQKIMALAKVTAVLGIIASVAGAIMLWVQASNISYYESAAKSAMNATGFGILIGGSLGSWIGSFAMYAFGQLVDDTADIKQRLISQPISNRAAPEKPTVSAPRPSDYSDLPPL